MKRKTVVALLAASMILSMAMPAAASDSTEESTEVTTEAATEAAAEADASQPITKAEDLDPAIAATTAETTQELPLVANEGDASFSLFVDDSSATGEFVMMDELKKQTNVDVELRLFPYETATERLNLDLNSGDYADVIAGWTLSDSLILNYGVNQGVFVPLEEYFEKSCPKITEILNLKGVREKMTAPDGHIYSIPYVVEDDLVGYTPYINGQWLENLGLEMPTTTDEFEAVLQAFKDQDANGNGDTTDEIPFSTDPNNKHIEAMAGYFGMPMNKKGLAIVDGETVYGGVSSKYREFLSWVSGMYQKGLIDTELYTQDSYTWEGKGSRDLYGVSIAYGSNEFSGIARGPEKSVWDVLPVLNTENGGIWLRDTSGFSVYRTQVVVTDNAEDPELICRWFDNAFSLENGIGISTGPVGTIVTKEDDGYHVIDKSTLSEEDQEKYSWANLWPQAVSKYMPAGFRLVEANPDYDEKAAVEKIYEPNMTEGVIEENWIDMGSIDTYADISTAIKDYFEQQQAMFVAGEQDINDDATWQAYVDGMYALGLEDWLSIQGISTIAE